VCCWRSDESDELKVKCEGEKRKKERKKERETEKLRVRFVLWNKPSRHAMQLDNNAQHCKSTRSI
jgi:hypothetical protein